MAQRYKFIITALELTKSHVVVTANSLAEAQQRARGFDFAHIDHQIVGGHKITNDGKRLSSEIVTVAEISDLDIPANYPLYIVDDSDPIIQTLSEDCDHLKDKYNSELIEYFTAGNDHGYFTNNKNGRRVFITNNINDNELVSAAINFALTHEPHPH